MHVLQSQLTAATKKNVFKTIETLKYFGQ